MKFRVILFSRLACVTLLSSVAHAGRVRTLYTNDRLMQPISLSMGRSTILRFDEKPKNAVIGNQNYFSLEFIGNDITIQPQGKTSTNIFVYTENQTYGLILNVGPATNYDDLVSIRYKPGYVSVGLGEKKKVSLLSDVTLHQSTEIKGVVKLELTKAIRSVAQGISILEITVTNLSKEKITLSEVQILVAPAVRGQSNQRAVMVKDVLAPGDSTLGRIILQRNEIEGMEIAITYKGKEQKIVLPRRINLSKK